MPGENNKICIFFQLNMSFGERTYAGVEAKEILKQTVLSVLDPNFHDSQISNDLKFSGEKAFEQNLTEYYLI